MTLDDLIEALQAIKIAAPAAGQATVVGSADIEDIHYTQGFIIFNCDCDDESEGGVYH